MQIEITLPAFRCQNDEDVFLSRLQELPALSDFKRTGSHLYVTLANRAAADALPTLEDICTSWSARCQVVDPGQ